MSNLTRRCTNQRDGARRQVRGLHGTPPEHASRFESLSCSAAAMIRKSVRTGECVRHGRRASDRACAIMRLCVWSFSQEPAPTRREFAVSRKVRSSSTVPPRNEPTVAWKHVARVVGRLESGLRFLMLAVTAHQCLNAWLDSHFERRRNKPPTRKRRNRKAPGVVFFFARLPVGSNSNKTARSSVSLI